MPWTTVPSSAATASAPPAMRGAATSDPSTIPTIHDDSSRPRPIGPVCNHWRTKNASALIDMDIANSDPTSTAVVIRRTGSRVSKPIPSRARGRSRPGAALPGRRVVSIAAPSPIATNVAASNASAAPTLHSATRPAPARGPSR